MGFQKQVNLKQAPATEGDFASANARMSVLASEGQLVAGAGGVVVGRFAWINPTDGLVSSHGEAPSAPDGFVHREQQALIQNYLEEQGMNVPEGFPVTLLNQGDFWVRNNGGTSAVRGDAAYARFSDGAVGFDSAFSGASVTGSIGSTNTAAIGATFTASADSDPTRLVVTSVTGYISVGDELSGTGITAGTTVLSQVSGTTGGAGTYQLSAANTCSAATVTAFGAVLNVSSTTGLISIGDTVSGGSGFPVGATILSQISGTTGGAGRYELSDPATAYVASASGVTTYGATLNVTAIISGSLYAGQPISGTGIPTGSVIDTQVSGTLGGIGVYTIDIAATAYAASTTITATGGILTKFKAASSGAVGELVKITSWA